MRNTSNWIHRTRTEKMQRNEQLELSKNHFISGFSTTDPDSPIRKWDRLLSMRDNLEPPSRLQGQPRVKSSSRLQSLKHSYLLTYYQKEWADRKKALVLSSEGSFIYRLLRVQYALLYYSYAYTFVRTLVIFPCLSIQKSTNFWTAIVRARALILCEIGAYSYLPTSFFTFNPKSVPDVLYWP